MTIEQQLFQLLILLMLFFWVYSKHKGQTFKETYEELTSGFRRDEDE
jgi:hypothetical protein